MAPVSGLKQPFTPWPPTWREHLRGLGRRLDTQGDVERVRIQNGQEPQYLDTRLNGFRTLGTTSTARR
jgi:hypothetical protein